MSISRQLRPNYLQYRTTMYRLVVSVPGVPTKGILSLRERPFAARMVQARHHGKAFCASPGLVQAISIVPKSNLRLAMRTYVTTVTARSDRRC